jgi:hypothetical protein
MEEWRCILNVGGEWWASHSRRLTPRRNLWYQLNMRLAGYRRRSGFGDEDTNLLIPARIESWFLCHPISGWVTVVTHTLRIRGTCTYFPFRAARNKTEEAKSKLSELRLLLIVGNDRARVVTNSGTPKRATWPPAGCANIGGDDVLFI